MKFVLFYHSLVSDWNHGNAHFLRGMASELLARGHSVHIYEPENGWSLQQLKTNQGSVALAAFEHAYPALRSHFYGIDTLDLAAALDKADVVIVHEWNTSELVAHIGEHHSTEHSYRLLFHDTHHRSVTAPKDMASYDLRYYDGVLAFGETIRQRYLDEGWADHVWTWHEAADTKVFHPIPDHVRTSDLVWVGNWGDEERSQELREFLIDPVQKLGIRADVFGVRYPHDALLTLDRCGLRYCGWLPNYDVPNVFAHYRVTVHVPRRPYVEALSGIPTIRPFEALACGIPLVSAFWHDSEGLFTPGHDFLVADNGREMRQHLRDVLNDPELALELADHGRRTILERHTCAHRIDELLAIIDELSPARSHLHA